MKLCIKVIGSPEQVIQTGSDDNIGKLKRLIKSVFGVEEKDQKLVYKGKTLLEEKNLSDYNITDNAKVHLFIKKSSAKSTSTSSAAAVPEVDPEQFWKSLDKLLEKHYHPNDAAKIVSQFKLDYQRLITTLSLDDMERLASRKIGGADKSEPQG